MCTDARQSQKVHDVGLRILNSESTKTVLMSMRVTSPARQLQFTGKSCKSKPVFLQGVVTNLVANPCSDVSGGGGEPSIMGSRYDMTVLQSVAVQPSEGDDLGQLAAEPSFSEQYSQVPRFNSHDILASRMSDMENRFTQVSLSQCTSTGHGVYARNQEL